MASEPLLIIGASARAAATSAAAAGYDVSAIDLFADVDLARTARHVRQSRRFPWDVLTLARELPPAPWLYTGGLENYPRLVARLAAMRPLLGNDAALIRRVRDVRQLIRFAEQSWLDITMPEIRFEPAVNFVAGESWLLKRRRSAGGLGVRRTNAIDVPLRRGEYLQREIVGTIYGASYLADARSVRFLGAAEQLVHPAADGRAPFRYAGSVTDPDISRADRDFWCDLGHALIGEFQLRGLFGVDLVRDAAGRRYLLEVNPRITASMDLWEPPSGRSVVGLHVAACRDGALSDSTPWSTPECRRGRRVVYSEDLRGVVPPDLVERLPLDSGTPESRRIADVPQAGTLIERDQPLVTVYAGGSSRAEVLRSLDRLAREIRQMFAESLVETAATV